VVHAWATASLYGHAPEVQVSRWGLPMITHILLSDPSLHDASENYNRAVPADEVALFSKPIRDFVEKVTALAHSAADPSAYATQLLARLAHRSCRMNWTRPPHSALPPSTAAASATT
jgi:hypothetical protein